MIELTDLRTIKRILALTQGPNDQWENIMFSDTIRLYASMEREARTGFRPDNTSPWLDFGWDCVTISKREYAHIVDIFRYWRYTEDNNGA